MPRQQVVEMARVDAAVPPQQGCERRAVGAERRTALGHRGDADRHDGSVRPDEALARHRGGRPDEFGRARRASACAPTRTDDDVIGDGDQRGFRRRAADVQSQDECHGHSL